MKKHPEFGYNICYPLRKNLKQALDVIRHQHEKMDGSGYPDGLKGDEISLPSRIMAVADIYDALTTHRPYRKAMPQEKVFSILQEEAQQGKLDEDVVSCLIELITTRVSAPSLTTHLKK
jgi:putative two-component system response regulator